MERSKVTDTNSTITIPVQETMGDTATGHTETKKSEFPDTYTCTYVVYKVWADSDQIWIFYKFLKLLQNQTKVPVL